MVNVFNKVINSCNFSLNNIPLITENKNVIEYYFL